MNSRLTALGGPLLLGVAAALVARRLARPSELSFARKTVVITGGSRGLGLAMAQQFAAEGARLVLLARSADQLEAAAEKLRSRRASVQTIACDIRDRASVRDAIQNIIRVQGRIDVLVNNAGVIQVTPFLHAQQSDYEDSLNTHFWGPLFMVQACLPHMRRQGHGSIVNISSVGGRVGVPHLIPYCVGKFALAGFSDALHAELRPMGINVTTVTPFLMRTGGHRNALVRGQHQKEAAWFALGSSRLTAISADRAARTIVNAVRRREARVAPGWPSRAAELMQALAPEMMADVAASAVRLVLPPPSDVSGNMPQPSRNLDLGRLARLLPTEAAVRLNQRVARDELRAHSKVQWKAQSKA
jgi:short-subunit dehydrogenase